MRADAPAGWLDGKLGDLLPLKYGKSLPERPRDPSGLEPVFGSSGRVGLHAEALTQGPALVVGRKGSVGSVYLSDVPCWPIDTVYFTEAPEGQNLWYFKYLLDALRLVQLDRSTAVPGLSRDDYNAVSVSIAPPEEQHKIVAEIDKQFSRLDEAVANLRRVEANLKRFTSSILAEAVEGRLVVTEADMACDEGRAFEHASEALRRALVARHAQWNYRGKYREPIPPLGNLAALPKGWCWSTVDQLAEVGTGATPNRSKAVYFEGGNVPWVTSSVANAPYVDQASEFVTPVALEQTNLTLYPSGTLLVAMYGEGKTRGKCTELRISAATNQALAALQVDAAVRPYVKLFLQHNYEATRKVASGGVQPNLNLSLVRAIKVPLPPLAEQHRIVAEVDRRLSIVREVEAEVDANLKRAQALRQAVLAAAFRTPGRPLPLAA